LSELFTLVERFPNSALFILPILGSIGLPVPEDAILFLCGILISKKSVLPLPGLMSVYAGILLSDFLIYSFGQKYGRRIVTHKIFRKILPPEKLVLLERGFIRSGPLIILLGRQFFWLRAKVFLVAGIMKMPVKKFLCIDAIAALFTTGIIVTLGYTGGTFLSYLNRISPQIGQISGIVVFVIAIMAFIYWLSVLRNRKISKASRLQVGWYQ
jgi:membrane protein DedA with SNARE-associated domain